MRILAVFLLKDEQGLDQEMKDQRISIPEIKSTGLCGSTNSEVRPANLAGIWAASSSTMI